MRYSYVSNLVCPKCDKTYDHRKISNLCKCGSPLLVEYDLDRLKDNWKPSDITGRRTDLWRYHELLPVLDEGNIVSLGEGMTPLISMESLGEDMDIPNLLMKDEGIIPTGTFKSRGAAMGVSKAKELDVKELAMPTNGNAGAAWSLYSSRANIAATIVMPVYAPEIKRVECVSSGANLHLVKGLISDAGKIVAETVDKYQLYDVSTLKEPYRIEGKKTMGLEILEQLNWEIPDVILYPTGGGVGLIGIYKAVKELQQLGWISKDKLPRLVAVQSAGCAPIVKAWEENAKESDFWEDSETIAFGINVPKALGDFLVLEALYDTGGCAVAVDDDQITEELRKVSEKEGAFICPEGAATFAAARKLRKDNWIREDEKVIALNTGTGLKYPHTIKVDVPVIEKDSSIEPAR